MLVKDCDCKGTSSTGQMRYEEMARGAESITFRAVLPPRAFVRCVRETLDRRKTPAGGYCAFG